jgi:Fe-S-cluster containining protein
MIDFLCDKCGICCTKLKGNMIYSKLDKGDGTCKYFEKDNNLCSIYNNRPEICNVTLMYSKCFDKIYTIDEFVCENKKICRVWQNEGKI